MPKIDETVIGFAVYEDATESPKLHCPKFQILPKKSAGPALAVKSNL